MLIKKVTPLIPAGKNLIPKAEYQGPILKLTKKEKTQIKQLKEKITELEIEQIKIHNFIENQKNNAIQCDYLYEKLRSITLWINEFQAKIKEIKTARFNQQKAQISNK